MTFTGVPTATSQNILILVEVSDGYSSSETTFRVFINHAPVCNSPSDHIVVFVGDYFTYNISPDMASDPDGSDLTLSVVSSVGSSVIPNWLQLSDRALFGIPQLTSRSLALQITASDGILSCSFTLQFVINSKPMVSHPISNFTANALTTNSYRIPDSVFSDEDGDQLEWSAAMYSTLPFPSWLIFRADIHSFEIQSGSEPGSYPIIVTVSDGYTNTSTEFTLMIMKPPLAIQTISDQHVLVNHAFSLSISGLFEYFGENAVHAGSQSNGSPLPAWLQLNDLEISGTPTDAHVGDYEIRLSAINAVGAASVLFHIVVGRGPEVDDGSISDKIAIVDSLFQYSLPSTIFNSTDAQGFTTTASLTGGQPLPSWLNYNNTSMTFSGTPTSTDNERLSVRVTASNIFSQVHIDFVIIVNTRPIVLRPLPDVLYNIGSSIAYIPILNGTFHDADGDVLSLSVILTDGSSLPPFLLFDPTDDTIVIKDALPVDRGLFSIRVIASDQYNSIFTDFLLTMNNPPRATQQQQYLPIVVDCDHYFSFNVNATFWDMDGDGIDYRVTTAQSEPFPSWLIHDQTLATLSGTPSCNNTRGVLTLILLASDSYSQVSQDLPITINHPPVVMLNLQEPMVVNVGDRWYFNRFDDLFVDADNDTIHIRLDQIPSWLAYDSALGLLQGIPTTTDYGIHTIKVIANDLRLETQSEIKIFVNRPPLLSGVITTQTVTIGKEDLNFVLPPHFASDEDKQTLKYSLMAESGSFPSWITLDQSVPSISGVPGSSDFGSLRIIATTTDGYASVYQVFQLVVNRAPFVQGGIPQQKVTSGTYFSYHVPPQVFVDSDGDNLVLTASLADGQPLPSWLNILSTSGYFNGIVPVEERGVYHIVVFASDGFSECNTTMELVINRPPVVMSPIQAMVVNSGEFMEFTIPNNTFVDEVGDVLQFSATQMNGMTLPSWLTFTSGRFFGTPSLQIPEQYNITVIASDSLAAISTTFTLYVNIPPRVDNLVVRTVVATNAYLHYTLPNDIFYDTDPLAYSISQLNQSLPNWISFDPISLVISGLVPLQADKLIQIKLIASDGLSSSSSILEIVTNASPVVVRHIGHHIAPVEVNSSLSVQGIFFDEDGDSLTFTATLVNGTSLPAWISFDSFTQTFEMSIPDSTRIAIRVTASDGVSSVHTDFVLQSDSAPVPNHILRDINVTVHTMFDFTLPTPLFTDADGDTMTFCAKSNNRVLPDWIVFDPIAFSISGITSSDSQIGSYLITIIA